MNNELHKLIETEQPNICQVVAYKGGEYRPLEELIAEMDEVKRNTL